MKTRLQLIFSTIALTILIWTYADQSGHVSYPTVVLVHYTTPTDPARPIVLRAKDSRAESKDLVRAEIVLRGPRSAIHKLEKDDVSGKFLLGVVLGEDIKPGATVTRNLLDDLAHLPEIRNRGVTLQRVTPPTVELEIDAYRNVPLDVEISAGAFEKSLVGKPRVNPEKVTARVLESELGRIGKVSTLRLPIEEELQARAEQAGSVFSFDVPTKSPWPGLNVIFSPDRVRVTAHLTRSTRSERITLVPLGVLVEPQNFFDRFTIQWQDETGGQFTQAINVRVPLEKAGQLTGSMIDAYVTVLDSDLPKEIPGLTASAPAETGSWIEREIRFVFPSGFEDVKLEGQPKTVKFRIRPTSEKPATPLVPALPNPPAP